MQEAVQDRRRARYVADQFAPVFQRSIACHHCRFELMPTHDDFEEILARSLGQLLHAHIVNDQRSGFRYRLRVRS